jgi:peptide/nickel transport system permease protein
MRTAGLRYAARRFALAVPTVAAVVTLSFTLIHLAPGDPVTAIAGDGGDVAYYAETRARFGLDRPVVVQFASYVSRIFRGDLGQSYLQGRPVRSMIAERLPATLLLTGSALIISTIVGIGVGMFAASRHRRGGDVVVSTISVLLFATPAFWLGQIGILWLALRTGWFPVQGMNDARVVNTGWAAVVDVAHHLALPVTVLSAQEVAAVARLLRTGLISELESAHIMMARSKGLPERTVYWSHALRRPVLPVLAVIGGRLGQILSGAVVVEIVFGWPGVGRLLLSAMQNRDVPVVLGVFLLTALTVIVANLIIDLVSRRLDPRIGERRLGS